MEQRVLPFSQRRVDWIFVGFFLMNFFFISYVVDIEQLIVLTLRLRKELPFAGDAQQVSSPSFGAIHETHG